MSALWNGHSVEDLSDLSGIDEDVLAWKLLDPAQFTIGEAAELAPHLGVDVHAYVTAVLS